jgi:hypothetical protein
VDQNSLNLDPDPAFPVNPDPDTEPDPNRRIRIQGFDDRKLKKKNTDLIKKLLFTTGETFSPQKI